MLPASTSLAQLSLTLRKDSPSLSSSRRACRLVLEAEYADSFQLRSCDQGLTAPPQQPALTGGDTPRYVALGPSAGLCAGEGQQPQDGQDGLDHTS